MPYDNLPPDELEDPEPFSEDEGGADNTNSNNQEDSEDSKGSALDKIKDISDLKDNLSEGNAAGEAGAAGGSETAGSGLAAGSEAGSAAGESAAAGGTGAAGAGSATGGTGAAGASAAAGGTGAAGAGMAAGGTGAAGATAAAGGTGAAGAAAAAGGTGLAAGAGLSSTGVGAVVGAPLVVASLATSGKGRKILLGILAGLFGCVVIPLGLIIMVIFIFLFPILGGGGTSTAEAANPGSTVLVVKKTATPSKIETNAPPTAVTYTITITNTSSHEATGVNLSDQLTTNPDSGFAAEIASQANGQDVAQNITIAANTTITRTFTLTVGHTDFTPGWVLINTAKVSGTVDGKQENSSSTAYVIIGKVGCGVGGNFATLLPNPVPPHPTVSGGSQSRSNIDRLMNGGVLPAAISASLATGLPCEILVGIHWVEGSWYDDGSFISGRSIGQVETDLDPADCAGYGATASLSPAGCIFPDLTSSAIASAKIYMGKIHNLFGHDQPTNFGEMIGGLACYNGCPGNANCGVAGYSGPCPPPVGIDNPYAVNWFDEQHLNMFLLYCQDGVLCPPDPFTRDGSATAAKEFYLFSLGR